MPQSRRGLPTAGAVAAPAVASPPAAAAAPAGAAALRPLPTAPTGGQRPARRP
ncbi:hypothetical protein [Micromonospora coxensis]|uniref:hypothetical protein n=1 Tax=Micromonospora coxensis TaxID=356852 RepID=UPI0012FD64BB|nr:hypothetical protein [Micromonospora coxensis]